MKKTFREKVVSWGNRTVKKHNWLKMPVLILVMICLGVYYVCLSFAHNGKKLSFISVALLFFFVNSSFGYRGIVQAQDVPIDEQGLQLAVEQTTTEDIDLSDELDDSELLKAFEEDAILLEENLDLYTLEDILAENQELVENQKSEETEEGENRAETDVPHYEMSDAETFKFEADDWRLILINKQHKIPDGYEFPLGTIRGSLQCDERVLEDLLAMMQAAKEADISLLISSPYRDYEVQTYLFNQKITKYMDRGLSYMEAYRKASQIVTAPNASEHQIGLAFDFNCVTYTALNAGFADTETGKWLKANSPKMVLSSVIRKEKSILPVLPLNPGISDMWAKRQQSLLQKRNLLWKNSGRII